MVFQNFTFSTKICIVVKYSQSLLMLSKLQYSKIARGCGDVFIMNQRKVPQRWSESKGVKLLFLKVNSQIFLRFRKVSKCHRILHRGIRQSALFVCSGVSVSQTNEFLFGNKTDKHKK